MTPEQYLLKKGFKLRKAPGEWQTQCPFCGDTNRYGHLYVNRDHGAFMCHRCGESGSFYTLQVKLGDKPEAGSKDLAEKWRVWSDVVQICQNALIENPEALHYLRDVRGFKASTIGEFRLGWVPRDLFDQLLKTYNMGEIRAAGLATDKDYPLFWDRILIPYYNRDQVVTLRAKDIGGNVLQAKDTSIHLFGTDQIRGHSEVYVAEGEFDAIFMHQMGYPTCAIPGALSFQEHWKPWFDGAKRVFVLLDADDAGRRGAYRVKELLGNKARIVEFPVPNGQKSTDVTEFFQRDGNTKTDLDEMVAEVRGQRLFTLGQGLQERDDLLGKSGIKLGWRDLDYAVTPGLLPGQVVTVLAKTGAGKTAWLTQIAVNLSSWTEYDGSAGGSAIPILFLSLEQTKSEIGVRLERMARLYNPWATRTDLDKWFSQLRICDENRIPSADVSMLIDEFTEELGTPPRLVIIDYLGYWARSFKGKSRYEQVSDAIMDMKRLAKDHRVAIITAHQVSRIGKAGQRLEMDFARDSGVVEETSDFMFGLYKPNETREDATYREQADVRLELLKSRHGNVGRQIMMMWAPYSLALISRGDKFEKRLENEWKADALQFPYEQVLDVHQGTRVL